jgi:serine/threonine protein kinase
MQALKALGRLHQQGVIHRDIKPSNLHQGEDGVLRVLDLGVALSGREPASMRALHAGTPSYVNPSNGVLPPRVRPWGLQPVKRTMHPKSCPMHKAICSRWA